jgi:hypothetical protein
MSSLEQYRQKIDEAACEAALGKDFVGYVKDSIKPAEDQLGSFDQRAAALAREAGELVAKYTALISDTSKFRDQYMGSMDADAQTAVSRITSAYQLFGEAAGAVGGGSSPEAVTQRHAPLTHLENAKKAIGETPEDDHTLRERNKYTVGYVDEAVSLLEASRAQCAEIAESATPFHQRIEKARASVELTAPLADTALVETNHAAVGISNYLGNISY